MRDFFELCKNLKYDNNIEWNIQIFEKIKLRKNQIIQLSNNQ